MIVAGAILLGMFALYHLKVRPAVNRIETLKRVLPLKEKNLRDLRLKSEEYTALQGELGRMRKKIENQPKDFGILTYLERQAKESRLEKNVAQMKPSTAPVGDSYIETAVEIKFENVTLEQITRFLLRMETSEGLIGVKAVHIRSSRKTRGLLNADVQVATLALAGKE